MAFNPTQVLTLAGVLLVLFVVILANNVSAARARGRAKAAGAGTGTGTGSAQGSSDAVVHPLLVKFARHEGSVVGETVAIDGDRLVLKQAGKFKSVPLAQAEERDGEVVLSGSIDWAAAEQAGTAWHESRRRADEGVSGTLTTSADVKSPAMEAVRARDGGKS